MIRLLEKIRNSIRLIVGPCLIEKASKEKNGIQANVILLGNEKHSGLRVLQQYGIASVPAPNSEAVALFVGGSRDNGFVVATQGDSGDIPALKEGEVALFSKFGQTVVLKEDGSIEMTAASGKDIVLKSRLVAASGILSNSDIKAVGDVVAGLVKSGGTYVETTSIHLKTHMHPTAGTGSPSSPTPGT